MRTRLIPAGLALAILTGCGEANLYKVAGEVTWQGQPVEDGQIVFLPEDGNLHPVAVKIVNGKFEARVPPGRMKVEVHGQKDMGYNEAMHQNTKAPYIPHEYNAQTTLKFEVERNDQNRADFRLPVKK
jgi:hypothetical protein